MLDTNLEPKILTKISYDKFVYPSSQTEFLSFHLLICINKIAVKLPFLENFVKRSFNVTYSSTTKHLTKFKFVLIFQILQVTYDIISTLWVKGQGPRSPHLTEKSSMKCAIAD